VELEPHAVNTGVEEAGFEGVQKRPQLGIGSPVPPIMTERLLRPVSKERVRA
jgi:hypothetical protein